MAKEVKPKKNPIKRQTPQLRRQNFNEVALGYDEETAVAEANRCLFCKKPLCISGCPVEIDIPAFVDAIRERKFKAAISILKDANSLPAICGRVCPQEDQCEKECVLAKKFEPVAIGRLERFAADWEAGQNQIQLPKKAKSTAKRIAIVGAGPGGLTLAGDLVKLGHEAIIFEAFHTAGGVLVYGIPEFRLPKDIVKREVGFLKKMGVKFEMNVVVGRTVSLEDLFDEGFNAIFIGVGAGLPVFKNIPGEELNGVYSANEYLTRANLMKAYDFPHTDTPIKKGRRVAVIGGGNVAMDAVRTALRLGAEEAMIIYRRGEKEMPARLEEIENAKEEGIIFHFLTDPIQILDNGNGWIKSLECLQMKLGEPDASGRRRPVPIEGSNFQLNVDIVIMAIAAKANPLLTKSTPGLKLNQWDYIEADENGKTNLPGVWAGGDIVTGSATVIEAMGAARRAARSIHEYLTCILHEGLVDKD